MNDSSRNQASNNTMLDCLVDGEIAHYLPVDDRGLMYGHGLFETVALEQGKPLMWEGHLDRLRTGCQRLGLAFPDPLQLERELATVAAGQHAAVGRLTLTAGSGGRGYAAPGKVRPRRIVTAHAWPGEMQAPRNNGVELVRLEYRLAHNRPLSRIKHLNRLEQVLAANELQERGAVEGLLLDEEGHAISCTSANLFVVVNGRLLTPRLDRCGIQGVTRAAILQQFPAISEKRRIPPDLLDDASEVFLCNSVRGVWPVRRIDDKNWDIGPLTRQVQDWLGSVSPLLARN